MIITIAGSMQFHNKYKEIKNKLEKKGHNVIIPLLDEAYSNEQNIKRKAMEDFNNNLKQSDALLVANFDKNNKPNYIGVNSLMEIGIAFILNKKIYILNSIPQDSKDELTAINVIELNGNINNLK